MAFFDWLLRLLTGAPSSTPAPRPRTPATPTQSSASKPSSTPPLKPLPNLDASQFAPLPASEMKKRAKALGRATWRFFGRDRIPPVSDPRTQLIDQGMVGAGIVTPEDLARLHAVGEEMDRVRPALDQAQTMADAAVVRSKEERAALKAAKKAEAEERKKKRAAEIAGRKATDIIYLGRGVSKGLADRRADVEKLGAAGLPVLATPADVAAAMGIAVPRLRWLAFHADAATRVHYIRFTIPKKGGGARELSAPHRSLAACQAWILKNILEKVPVKDCAHGFVRGRSTVTNAAPHAARAAVVNLDLKDFFPSIVFARVRGIFRKLGYSPAVATVLALLCTEAPRRTVEYAGKRFHVATGPRGLPQGACTSPALSNLAARRLDARLLALSAKAGWAFTRYADDLTFSAPDPAAKRAAAMLNRVRKIVADEKFVVNEKKTRVQRAGARQTVTGLVVNARPAAPRKLVRRLRAILHRAKFDGIAAQNKEARPNFEAWLQGTIAYVAMVNPTQGGALRKCYEAALGKAK